MRVEQNRKSQSNNQVLDTHVLGKVKREHIQYNVDAHEQHTHARTRARKCNLPHPSKSL